MAMSIGPVTDHIHPVKIRTKATGRKPTAVDNRTSKERRAEKKRKRQAKRR
jgi:hypothetical protein